MLEYRVLGPLVVLVDGRPMRLGGRRPQLVLATLLSRPNRAISQEALIDLVWAGDPPEAAKSTLQSYVYGLRRTLGADAILRSGDGYRVELDAHSLDAMRFEELVIDARRLVADDPSRGSTQLCEALAMWRGSAYEGLESSPGLMTEIARLDELRLAATELRNEAELVLGNHAALIGELDALVREHPLRERFRAQQMLALYRGGRQAEALRAFQAARHHLGEELGIEPSAELRDLEQRMLEHDPSLDPGHPGRAVERSGGSPAVTVRGYEVTAILGRGRFGTVYQARRPTGQRDVAVKVIQPRYAGTADFVRRFEREAQRVAQLDHPHIVPLHDYWRDPDGAFLVMPLMRGGNLEAALGGGQWSLHRVLAVVDQICGALAHAHRRGVAHRDIKATNVLLDSEGNAYLSDFGIGPAEHHRIEPGQPAETDESFEALVGADVSALGALAFGLLTGMLVSDHRQTPRLGDARPDLPLELGFVLANAMNEDQSTRYERVDCFLRAFRQSIGADVVVLSPESHTDPEPIRNPYKGLRAFRDSDAADFFGRDALVDDLVAALATHNVVTVVGPSGSGKSSVVRAGLIPALRAGALRGSGEWFFTDMFPGSHPFEELEAALLRVAVDIPPDLLGELSDERGLLRVTKRILPTDDDTLLLLVDQFEELFSTVRSEVTRSSFLDNLVSVASDDRSRLKVVLTLRADYLDRPLAYQSFAGVLGAGLVTVGPPSRDGLAQAIAAPARAVGVEAEPGLIGRIIADVVNQPGALPLLQFAMTELFAAREGSLLTIGAYEAMGGVQRALGLRAEELYTDMTPSMRRGTRQIFLRLVSVSEGHEPTRRRVPQSELRQLSIDDETIEQVLGRFGRLRLVGFDREPHTRAATVELAHDALLDEWVRLRNWIDERREALIVARRISELTREWVSSGCDTSFLLRGARLRQAESFPHTSDLARTDDEVRFVEASLEAEHAESRAVRRRRRLTTLSLTAALIVFMSLAAAAWWQWDAARARAREMMANDLAYDSIDALDEDPELALLLALEAAQVTRESGEPLDLHVRSSLLSALDESRIERRIDSAPRAGEFAGSLMLMITPEGRVAAHSIEDGTEVWTHRPGGRALAMSVSPNEELVVVVHRSTTADQPSTFTVVDVAHGDVVAELPVPPFAVVLRASWSSDSQQLATLAGSTTSAELTVFDPRSGERVASFPVQGASDIALLDTGSIAVSEPEANRISFFDMTGSHAGPPLVTPGFAPGPMVYDPLGARLVAGSSDDKGVQAWDLSARELLWESTLPHPALGPIVLDLAPETETVAMTSGEGAVALVNLRDGTQGPVLRGHADQITGIDFDTNGARLVTTARSESGQIWNVTPGGVDTVSAGPDAPCRLTSSAEGTLVAITGTDGTLSLVNARDSEVLRTIPGQQIHFGAWVTADRGFDFMSWTDHDGVGRVWEVDSWEAVAELPPCHLPKALSHDGSLLVAEVGCDGPKSGRVIDVSTGQEVLDLGEGEIWDAAFASPDADDPDRYIVVNRAGVVEVLGSDGQQRAKIETQGDVVSMAVDGDGRHLAVGTDTGTAIVYSLPDLIEQASVENAEKLTVQASDSLWGIAVDDSHLATSSHGELQVWDIGSGRLVAQPAVDIDSPPFSVFASDGESLIYADGHYELRRLILDDDELIRYAHQRLTREFTAQECLTYLGSNCSQADA